VGRERKEVPPVHRREQQLSVDVLTQLLHLIHFTENDHDIVGGQTGVGARVVDRCALVAATAEGEDDEAGPLWDLGVGQRLAYEMGAIRYLGLFET